MSLPSPSPHPQQQFKQPPFWLLFLIVFVTTGFPPLAIQSLGTHLAPLFLLYIPFFYKFLFFTIADQAVLLLALVTLHAIHYITVREVLGLLAGQIVLMVAGLLLFYAPSSSEDLPFLFDPSFAFLTVPLYLLLKTAIVCLFIPSLRRWQVILSLLALSIVVHQATDPFVLNHLKTDPARYDQIVLALLKIPQDLPYTLLLWFATRRNIQ